jgi:hypothetical protein
MKVPKIKAIPRLSGGCIFLDGYLRQSGIQNAEFAELLRQIRRHARSPTAALVRHWRCGSKIPGHDMRLFIEIATAGQVGMERWCGQQEDGG